MNPRELLDVARSLLASDLGEAGKRSSVSRAYYGAFHCCASSLPSEFIPDRQVMFEAGSHKALVNAVKQWGMSMTPGRTDAQQAARRLAKLRNARNTADYKLNDPFTFDADDCLREAEAAHKHILDARQLYDKSVSPCVVND